MSPHDYSKSSSFFLAQQPLKVLCLFAVLGFELRASCDTAMSMGHGGSDSESSDYNSP
jgi:hypothetical protein